MTTPVTLEISQSTSGLQSAEDMEALMALAIQRHMEGSASSDLLARAIMQTIQVEVIKAKEEIISTLARSFKGAA